MTRALLPLALAALLAPRAADAAVDPDAAAKMVRGSVGDALKVLEDPALQGNNDFDTLMKKLERKIAFMQKKADKADEE